MREKTVPPGGLRHSDTLTGAPDTAGVKSPLAITRSVVWVNATESVVGMMLQLAVHSGPQSGRS